MRRRRWSPRFPASATAIAVILGLGTVAACSGEGESEGRVAPDVVERPDWADAFAVHDLSGTVVLHRVGPVDDIATDLRPEIRQRVARAVLEAEGALPARSDGAAGD